MTDISLNPQLGARLKAVQQAWGHDSPGETLATIYDALINGWTINLPSTPVPGTTIAIKARLKARHVEYFAQMSTTTGCNIPELARSFLIQWICSQDLTHPLPKLPPSSPKLLQLSPKKATKVPRKVKVPPKPETVTPLIEQTTSKTTGRDALRSLL